MTTDVSTFHIQLTLYFGNNGKHGFCILTPLKTLDSSNGSLVGYRYAVLLGGYKIHFFLKNTLFLLYYY